MKIVWDGSKHAVQTYRFFIIPLFFGQHVNGYLLFNVFNTNLQFTTHIIPVYVTLV